MVILKYEQWPEQYKKQKTNEVDLNNLADVIHIAFMKSVSTHSWNQLNYFCSHFAILLTWFPGASLPIELSEGYIKMTLKCFGKTSTDVSVSWLTHKQWVWWNISDSMMITRWYVGM